LIEHCDVLGERLNVSRTMHERVLHVTTDSASRVRNSYAANFFLIAVQTVGPKQIQVIFRTVQTIKDAPAAGDVLIYLSLGIQRHISKRKREISISCRSVSCSAFRKEVEKMWLANSWPSPSRASRA